VVEVKKYIVWTLNPDRVDVGYRKKAVNTFPSTETTEIQPEREEGNSKNAGKRTQKKKLRKENKKSRG